MVSQEMQNRGTLEVQDIGANTNWREMNVCLGRILNILVKLLQTRVGM